MNVQLWRAKGSLWCPLGSHHGYVSWKRVGIKQLLIKGAKSMLFFLIVVPWNEITTKLKKRCPFLVSPHMLENVVIPCRRYFPPRNRFVRASWPMLFVSCSSSTRRSLKGKGTPKFCERKERASVSRRKQFLTFSRRFWLVNDSKKKIRTIMFSNSSHIFTAKFCDG